MTTLASAWNSVDESKDEPATDPESGLSAISNWWNSSCNDGVKRAEKNLIKQFVDSDVIEYKSEEIAIDFDAEPVSVKQKRLRRSQSLSFFKFNFNNEAKDGTTSGNPQNGCSDEEKHSISHGVHGQASMSSSALKQPLSPLKSAAPATTSTKCSSFKCSSKDAASKIGPKERIHTLSFRVKQDRLVAFSAHCRQNDFQADAAAHSQSTVEDPRTKDPRFKKFMSSLDTTGTSTLRDIRRELHTYQQSMQVKQVTRMVPIVLLHGYGCAGGIFIPSITTIYENLFAHVEMQESPVIHLLDWLGGGMSSRPKFQCETTEEAEHWFVESLEAWRKAMGIEKMVLGAHSIGGYCASCYALRYPQFIEHLVLISPCGLPAKPDKWEENLLSNYGFGVRTLFKTVGKLWEGGWTPHDAIRLSGPKAKDLVHGMVQKRLYRLGDEHPLKQLLVEYLYHVIAQPGSGEYALGKLLYPGAWARSPLSLRLGELKKYQSKVSTGYHHDEDIAEEEEEEEEEKESVIGVDQVLNTTLSIDFIYGAMGDWMNASNAVKLRDEHRLKCNVYVNDNCGHQLILENYIGFGNLLGSLVAKSQICANF